MSRKAKAWVIAIIVAFMGIGFYTSGEETAKDGIDRSGNNVGLSLIGGLMLYAVSAMEA